MQDHINMQEETKEFKRLLEIMNKLRAECPWDKKQNNESLRHLTIEEVYELGDAILNDDNSEIMKELGDIMLHIVFYAKIGEEKGAFNMSDVLRNINEKLIRRHPHIFSDVVVRDEEEVKENWEKIKMKEGRKSVLEGVPKGLPAMVKAFRMQEKAKGVGFDWNNTEQVWHKVLEEIKEFNEEVKSNSNLDRIEDEFGDILFALINYARFIGVNPENALERTNKKFIKRFNYIEEHAQKEGRSVSDMTLDEMEEIWCKAKKEE